MGQPGMTRARSRSTPMRASRTTRSAGIFEKLRRAEAGAGVAAHWRRR